VFANIGWGEMLLLVVVGLVVLGPERLPGAIAWTAGTIRQARDYLSGATRELREELGPEFEDLRQPLSEIQKLRGMTPRAACASQAWASISNQMRNLFSGSHMDAMAGRV
jgi:sec-independent protein translocase protein TatB